MKKILLIVSLTVTLFACETKKQEALDASYLHAWNVALENGIINDFFSPPVAGRMYTYPNLIAHLVVADSMDNLGAQLKGLPKLSKAATNQRELVACYAFYYVGKKMVYSFNYLDDYLVEFENQLSAIGYSQELLTYANSKGEEISIQFLKWVNTDGYKESRSDTKFTLSNKEGAWKPTPTDFADALEPNWHKIRPFFIDSAAQFTARYKPYPFDMTNQQSDFYKELKEVKDQVDQTNEEQLATSKYWDCNPLAPQHNSHATYAEKKLTPGGHWLSIGRNISIQKKDDFLAAAKMYTLVSLSINDGFVACWQAKYHYDYIRPITAIQEQWDSKWNTLILTPNFPEYPSGHSVISGVASTVLASIYGDKISFTDNAEEPFGMTPRNFTSLTDACDQAAMSRFWAGIHFKKAILDGVIMGREIGNTILKKQKQYK